MTMLVGKRDLLLKGLTLGASTVFAGMATSAPGKTFVPPVDGKPELFTNPPADVGNILRRIGKTTKLFNAPALYPNGLAVSSEGLWIAEELLAVHRTKLLGLPMPPKRGGGVWLVDWQGMLIRTVPTPSPVTSGLAYGDEYLWVCANAAPYGVYQVDKKSKVVSHRQIPLGTTEGGGGCHGAVFHKGKLWIVSRRLHSLMKIDPTTWTTEAILPIPSVEGFPRYHDMTFDDEGNIWLVVANKTRAFATLKGGLLKIDADTGRVLMIVDLAPGSPDPHGLTFHDGRLICCDSGTRPGWDTAEDLSPRGGEIFSIEVV